MNDNDSLPRVAVSQCLLGDKVRYDGTDNLCSEIYHISQNNFEIVAFCPEVTIGMGVPRLPIRLSVVEKTIRARRVNDNYYDFTEALKYHASEFLLSHSDLRAVINKTRSPSCGHLTTKLYKDETLVNSVSSGIFIDEVIRLKPEIFIIDEIEFMDSRKRRDFLDLIKKGPE